MLNPVTGALFDLINTILGIYIAVVVAAVIMSWLIQFNVVNRTNRFVYMLADILYRLTEPIFKRIRRLLPNLGGLDLSPIIVFLAIYFIRDVLWRIRIG